MRILERYITGSILKIFIGTVLVFCFLYILIDVTSTLDEIIDRQIPFKIIVQYYLYFFPMILVQTSSIACLISVLFTFGSLQNSNEIIVMRSSGLNFWKITRPALVFGIVVSAFIFFLNEKFIPEATHATKQIRDEYMTLKVDKINRGQTITNLTFYGLQNRLYFIDSFNPKTNEMSGITIIGHDETQNIKEKIVAYNATWTGIAWKFLQCQITSFENTGTNTPVKVKIYKEKLMDIQETPEDFMKQRLNVYAMNMLELKQYINRFSNSGAARALNNLRVDFHQKMAYPFANFVIVLIGLPFALLVRNRKGATFTSIGIALGVGFLFYVANAVAIALGKGGAFSPIVAAWAAPVIFTAIAITVIETNF